MIVPSAWPQVLDLLGTPLVIEPWPGEISSDAGLLPICQFDQRVDSRGAFTPASTTPATLTSRECYCLGKGMRSRITSNGS